MSFDRAGPGEGSPSPPKLSPSATRQSLSSDVTTKTLRKSAFTGPDDNSEAHAFTLSNFILQDKLETRIRNELRATKSISLEHAHRAEEKHEKDKENFPDCESCLCDMTTGASLTSKVAKEAKVVTTGIRGGADKRVLLPAVLELQGEVRTTFQFFMSLAFFLLFGLGCQMHYRTYAIHLQEKNLRLQLTDSATEVNEIPQMFEWMEQTWFPFLWNSPNAAGTTGSLLPSRQLTLLGGSLLKVISSPEEECVYVTGATCYDQGERAYNYDPVLNGWDVHRRLATASDAEATPGWTGPSRLMAFYQWLRPMLPFSSEGWYEAEAPDATAAAPDAETPRTRRPVGNLPPKAKRLLQGGLEGLPSKKTKRSRHGWMRAFFEKSEPSSKPRRRLAPTSSVIMDGLPEPVGNEKAAITVIPMSRSLANVSKQLQTWQTDMNRLVSQRTLIVGLETMVRNEQTQLLTHVFVNFLLSRSGAIFVQVRLLSLHTVNDPWAMILAAIWVIFLLGCIVALLAQIIIAFSNGRAAAHAKKMSTLVQWAIVLIGVVIVALFVTERMEMRRAKNLVEDYTSARPSVKASVLEDFDISWFNLLHFVIFWATRSDSDLLILISLFHVLILLQFLAASKGQPRLALLVNTLEKAFQDIVHLFVVFLFIFSAFVIAGHILFGAKLKDFSTVQGSFAKSLEQVVSFKTDWDVITQQDWWTAAIWVWLMIIVVSLVVINIVLAVIFDCYGKIRSGITEKDTLWTTLRRQFMALRYMNQWYATLDLLTGIKNSKTESITQEGFRRIFHDITEEQVTTLSGPPLCLGDATLMGRLDLLIIQWGFNTIAVGQRVGSNAPADGVLISMRDIRLRSCGVDVPLFPAALESQEVEMLVELPEDVIQERRWGYGNISPFRCVRWVSSGFGRPGQWIADGCSNAYRGQDDPPVGDKAGLAEGVLRCRCTSLVPGTWAVEIVPRPPVIVEPPEVLNTSVKTLVAYAALIMWLPLLVPLLVWALMGDLILSFHGEEATKKLAEGLLPAALISGGVWGDAEKLLQNSPWPLRCSFSLHLVAFVIFLRSLCGAGRRQRWRDEAKDVSRYRNALCYARLKGSRVEPEAPLRAAEPQAAQASLPAQDPTIRERAPVAKWRKGPAALPASDQPAAAVKVPVAETQEQPKLLSHQPDPIGALLKQPDAFEEQQAKQAALHMTEYDWSEQVRGNVTSTGVQRSVLPEGWIMQNAGSQVYYVNLLDGKSTWERPTQPAMNVLSMQELRDLLGRAADGIALRKQLEEMLRPRIAERLAAMGDVAAQGQDRRFHHEAMHRAPAPEEENVAPPDSLRQAALVETSTGEFQASMSGVEGSLRLPLRFRALAWGFCTLLGACFLRSWPVTAALLPCLRPSRLERATKFAYRLNAALAFAAGALYLQPIADFSSIPEAVNADRPDAELWAELEITQPLAIALGCASVLVGRFLAALLPVFPAVKAKELDNFGARSNWWKRAWIKQRTTEGFALFLGIGAAFLAVLLSAVQPQPRGAVAMASFCWAALMELMILPILSSLMQALSIYCVARDCCCGPSTAFLARLPGLLRFPPKGSWTSRDVLFKHLEALNSETSPRHQTKR